MTDLRIADAPELTAAEVNDSLKVPTGGYGNYSITMITIRDWLLNYKMFATQSYVDGKVSVVATTLNTHTARVDNPHQVTKAQIGLANVDNTSDINKPISSATQTALTNLNTSLTSVISVKANTADVDTQLALKANKTDVYTKSETYKKQESNDLVNNSISTALTPVNASLELAKRGIANRYDSSLTYNSGERVILVNGDIVKSTIDDNANDPNADMTGWVLDSGAFVLKTVSELVSKNLKDGDIVRTIGYYNTLDEGGAVYLISNTSTEYSIPLNNGLHAIFKDSFDIRKFGIRSSETLDQTEEIRRMVAYADDRVYEIDFHGFSIMTPKIVHYTNSRGTVYKGMGFSRVHKLKNLFIANDKTEQLYQGTSPIHFMPKADGFGLFELENVVFDPYVADYNLISMDEDGACHGFAVRWYDGAAGGFPENMRFVSGYSFKFTNIKFKTPAISYNLATAGLYAKNLEAKNMSGEYIGIYLAYHAESLNTDNIKGVYRDDLHASNRELVTNLIHEEAEINGGTVYRDTLSFKNLECTKYTTQEDHVCVKMHRAGTQHIKNMLFDNTGIAQLYSGETSESADLFVVDNIYFKNREKYNLYLNCYVKNLTIDARSSMQNLLQYTKADKVYFKGDIFLDVPLCIDGSRNVVNEVYFESIVVSDNTYGLFAGKQINSISIQSLTLMSRYLLRCKFTTLEIESMIWDYDGVAINPITSTSSGNSSVLIGKLVNVGNLTTSYTELIKKDSGDMIVKALTANNLNECELGSTTNIIYKNLSYISDFDYASQTLSANSSNVITRTLRGCNFGDVVKATLTTSLNGSEIKAEVIGLNTVRITHSNPTSASVTTGDAKIRLYLN